MDYANSIWQVGIAALLAGTLIGALAYRLFAPSVKHADEVKSELDQARDELNSYKASVDEHFQKTSDLVNDLTQDYVKVYQHLAEGAQSLGDSKHFNNLLEQQKGKVLISVGEAKPAPEVIDSDPVVEAAVDPELTTAKQDASAEAFVKAGPDTAETRPASADANSGAAPAAGDAAPAEAAPEAPSRSPAASEAATDTAKLEPEAGATDAAKPAQDSGEKAEDPAKARPVTH